MTYLDKVHLVLMGAQRLKEAVNTITGEPKNRINAPANEPLNDEVGNSACHDVFSSMSRSGCWRQKPPGIRCTWQEHNLCQGSSELSPPLSRMRLWHVQPSRTSLASLNKGYLLSA